MQQGVQQQAKGKKKQEVQVDPVYEQKFYSQKIERLNKGDNSMVPIEGQKNYLITSALPYVNNIPHLGNLIGCVLPADVFARYCRLRGHNAIYICGSDEYGTATEMAARKEGLTPREICDKYWKIHDEVYKWFDIDFDYFGRTSTEKQTTIAQSIFLDNNKNGNITQKTMDQCFCPSCNIFLADRYVTGTCPFCKFEKATGDQCDNCQKLLNPEQLIEMKCQLCSTKPVIKETKHCYLDLPKLTPPLSEWMKEVEQKGFWTEVSKQISWDWINRGLIERCITRDLKWGIPTPLEGFEDKVLYVWFDAPIGYISITANFTDNWEKWWKNPKDVLSYQFMAKDNVPFHTIIFPAALIGSGLNWTKLHHISATHYLNYEDGKFSKRNGTGVFGDNAKETGIPSEVWRYYLLTNRPEHSDTVFSWKDFAAKNNNELLPNVGNLIQRSLKFAQAKFDSKVPGFTHEELNEKDKEFLNGVWKLFQDFLGMMEGVQIKQALRTVMEISSAGNLYLQTEQPWDKKVFESGRSKVVIGVVVNFIRFLSALFEPFLPSFSAKINFTLGFEQRTQHDERILQYIAEKNDPVQGILTLVKEGQLINQPLIMFREFKPEEVEEWRLKFGGQQVVQKVAQKAEKPTVVKPQEKKQ